MKISLRVYVILILLIIAAFITVWSQMINTTPVSLTTPDTAIIEESMVGVDARRFDKQGQLFQIATMGSWLRHKGQTVTQMKTPTLTLYRPDQSVWYISSENGQGFQKKMNGRFEKLHLSEKVKIERQMKEVSWQLHTQTLLFLLDKSIATTQDPVTVFGPGFEMKAKGMRAELGNSTIEFLKEIHCRYANPQA